MTPPLLDTHAWIWWVDQDVNFGAKTIAVLDSLPRDQRPFLCDISLWEVAMFAERGRLELDVPLAEWLDAAADPRSVQILQSRRGSPLLWRPCRKASTATRRID